MSYCSPGFTTPVDACNFPIVPWSINILPYVMQRYVTLSIQDSFRQMVASGANRIVKPHLLEFDFPAVLLFAILIIVIGWYDYWLQILEPENSLWKASSLFLYEASIIFCEFRDPETYSVKQPRATVSTVSSRNKLCLLLWKIDLMAFLDIL